MDKPLPDIRDRERFTTLLILGEILTKRGEIGPLARVWRPAGPSRRQPPPPPQSPKKG